MLGDGGDDGNVNLGVASVPERVETTRPRRNDSSDGQQDESTKSNHEDDQNKSAEQSLELLAGKLSADPLNSSDQLEETKDT